ncbi:RNA-directed DNA polymerase, eukaryota, reverse transcriptase zinc-binding domain protein, partial [Tanacetum coccineum]
MDMRMKRDQKIPQNLEDYVHSINTTKLKNKKTTKKNGNYNVNLDKSSLEKRGNGDCGVNKGKVGDECKNGSRDGDDEANGNDSFNGDLNGTQFPPISGMGGNENENNVGMTDEKEANKSVNVMEGIEKDKERVSAATSKFDVGAIYRTEVCTEVRAGAIYPNKVVSEPGYDKQWQKTEGINEVINNGPWMVNNKPMVVQKWCIDMCLDKTEPKKIPVWIKMINVPMEAWSVKGISALASSVGKPVIMDEVTTKMCMTGVRRFGFARVVVEIDAEKGIKDKIEVMYRSKNVAEGTKKTVDVEYSWIPSICSKCKVFGHTDNNCKFTRKDVIDNNTEKSNANEFTVIHNRRQGREGFYMNKRADMQNGIYDKRRNEWRQANVNNKWKQNNGVEYRKRGEYERKNNGAKGNMEKNIDDNEVNTKKEQTSKGKIRNKEKEKSNQKGSNSVDSGIGTGTLGSNRFTLLNSLMNEEYLIPNVDQRNIVDEYLKQFDAAQEIERNDDVLDGENGTENGVLRKEVEGVWLISKSRQYMFLLVETIDKKSKFFCTVIYASNSGMERRKLWKDLEIQKIVTNGVPWVILGDFNVTLKVSEHSNGSTNLSSEMSEFQDCINNIEVDDLHSEGFHFTWTKSLKNPKCRTLKKLDRVMVNEAFIDSFRQAHGVFLPYIISDHSPIIMRIPNGVQKRKGAFRFSNFITDKKEFLPTWNKSFEGHTMYRVVQKLKTLKRKLKQLSWKNGNVFVRAEELRIKAIQDENSLLCQKARIEWLREGDKNTAFFHKTIKERVYRGRIMSIRNEEGARFENDDVPGQIVKHFENFLGKTSQVNKLSCGSDIVKNKLSNEEASKMVRPISDSEIKNAMFEIEDSKAPGPDGYTLRFYKSAWSIVGKEVCQAVKDFFLTGKLLREVNVTLISLVLKTSTPDKVSDFRPIACCNVLYKCISKIMTNRIKEVLGNLVNENQSAFIGGRQITDNILLSQELLRGYNRKQNVKKVSFKIDLQKAYDTISWEFLKDVLVMFSFHKDMIGWIMACVTSTKFTININGKRVGYFKGGMGLRQGDPISPYLFTLVMEVLNLLIKKNIEKCGNFKYHYGCKKLEITHLCFADDLLVFCHGDFGKLQVRYLGVPLITKQISIGDCKPLIDKVKTKINNWKNKVLSYAGRVQLIASVLSSMQNYWASVFLLPKQVIYEINKVLKGFLWCQGKLSKGKAKVSWGAICKPKDQGGLGLKNLGVWNEVLMIKHLWNVATKKNTLWVKWIYVERLKGKSIWEIHSDSSSINVWHDKWSSVSPLSDFINTRDIYDARLRNSCTIREVIHEERWSWPSEWNDEFDDLRQLQTPLLNDEIEDTVVWKSRTGKELQFKISNVWKDLSCNDTKDDWFSMAWFAQSIPRHAFVSWLAVQKRLMTQDKLLRWRPNDDLKCALCNKCPDSHNHLFFTCDFSKGIWNELYYLWQERNNRLFRNEKRDSNTVFNTIKETVGLKLTGIKVKESRTVKEVEGRWSVRMQSLERLHSEVSRPCKGLSGCQSTQIQAYRAQERLLLAHAWCVRLHSEVS